MSSTLEEYLYKLKCRLELSTTLRTSAVAPIRPIPTRGEIDFRPVDKRS
jgi:hypothetical protein